MTKTDDLIRERVKIAKAVHQAGLTLVNEHVADATFMAETFQSQYVAFRVGDYDFTIRIADHAPSKPGMSECLYDTSGGLSADDVILRLKVIGANVEAWYAAFDECGDLDAARKFVNSSIGA